MNILIAYGTNSNSTYFAAHVVATILREHNHTISIDEVKNIDASTIHTYDLVIFGTNTWYYHNAQGQPHIWYFDFEKSIREEDCAGRKFAIFALGDSSYIEFCHSADYIEKMVRDMGGQLVAESLRIDGYYFDESKNNLLLEQWALALVKEP